MLWYDFFLIFFIQKTALFVTSYLRVHEFHANLWFRHVIPSRLFHEKTHFLILAGSVFCQIWLGRIFFFHKNKTWRNHKFAWNSCIDVDVVHSLLSFQKVCRTRFFSWMSERDVTYHSQTLVGCPDQAWRHALAITSCSIPQNLPECLVYKCPCMTHQILSCPPMT